MLAVVYYLVSTIVALQRITNALDEAITGVVGIIEKSAPVDDVVTSINTNLDAGVDLLEGLLVKKAGMQDAVGLVDGLYPGAAAEGFRELPGKQGDQVPANQRGVHEGDADAGPSRTRGPDRGRQPERPGAPEPGLRQHGRPRACTPRSGRRDRRSLARSPVIGTDSPVQYEPSESPGVRKRMPVAVGARSEATEQQGPAEAEGGVVKSGLAFLRRLKNDDR